MAKELVIVERGEKSKKVRRALISLHTEFTKNGYVISKKS
jgi:phage anti-repressor protein